MSLDKLIIVSIYVVVVILAIIVLIIRNIKLKKSLSNKIEKLERDKNKLQETYDLGLKDGKNILEDLKEYLKKEK